MGVTGELRELLRLSGFRKLLTVRLVSQAADGMFQVGLASAWFFSPDAAGSAAAVAGRYALMLAPFTIVGPFAGVLLDRWRRRQVLMLGNAVRAVLTLGMAATVMIASPDAWGVLVLGLAALSVNRFLLAGLSAGLPNVVAGPLLLTANSITPTLGAGAAFVGGGVGFVVAWVLPPGRGADATALACAAVVMLLGALAAQRLHRDQLGPTDPRRGNLRDDVSAVLRDLAAGARYLAARRTPGQALLVMAAHRFLYGVVFIASILIARNLLAAPGDSAAGLGTFAVILGLTAVGGAAAVVVTPTLSRFTGPQAWIALMLLLAAASQLLLCTTPARAVVLTGAGLLGLAAQAAKIAVDTIVQRDTDDAFRGRAFALYDVLYNAAFVGAAVLAALFVPDDGWSRGLFGALAVAYVLVAGWVWLRADRSPADVTLPDLSREPEISPTLP
ncbi:MFS transporter [Xylanimonas allomyrinae]|uniref:MFS transporter n=1 Tax=Xylanimonas allomyrinae TaxID=2509459 RepID=A0A4P6EQ61_9MICO|nr:MFS transporter [Xylanimonas allomyrinae]QAY63963.1 MFS transporter [Xylanimonas allomyrinae]